MTTHSLLQILALGTCIVRDCRLQCMACESLFTSVRWCKILDTPNKILHPVLKSLPLIQGKRLSLHLQVLCMVAVMSSRLDWKSHPGMLNSVLRVRSTSLRLAQQACLSRTSQQLLQQQHSLELMTPPQWTKAVLCCQLNKAWQQTSLDWNLSP